MHKEPDASGEIEMWIALARSYMAFSIHNMNRMFLSILTACFLIAATDLYPQSEPSLYYGPYEQASVEQFAGEWTRSDGTYKLLITVESGKAVAQYFNPAAINVESTSVKEADDYLSLKIVLRDQGYDGSNYELQYIPEYRFLVGIYTITGQAPTEVYFTR